MPCCIGRMVSYVEFLETHRMRPHHCHAYIRVHIPICIVSASTSASVSDNVGLSLRGSRRVDACGEIFAKPSIVSEIYVYLQPLIK